MYLNFVPFELAPAKRGPASRPRPLRRGILFSLPCECEDDVDEKFGRGTVAPLTLLNSSVIVHKSVAKGGHYA